MKLIILSFLLSTSVMFGQGARFQSGSVPTPVPIYNFGLISNQVYIMVTNIVGNSSNVTSGLGSLTNLAIVLSNNNYDRFLFVNTNSPTTNQNKTIRYDSLVAELEAVIGGTTNGQTAAQVALQIAATNNNILINLYDPHGTALAIGGNNSNLTYLVAQQNSNLTYSIGQSTTNYANAIGVIATNNVLWVATTGNDTTGNGMSNNPFASVTKAITTGGNRTTVIVRGGDYSMAANGDLDVSGKKIVITGYQGERVKFWATYCIPASSFVSLSNGIYTASGPILAGFTNCLEVSTNSSIQTAFHPQGFLVYGSNSPSGAQTFSEFYPPKLLSSFGETNRCEFTAIGQGASVPSIVNSNAWWVLTNQIFYIKFPVSNSPTMIMTSSTNKSDIFIASGNAISDVSLNGLEFYGFNSTLACTNVGKWGMSRCMVAMPYGEFTAVNNAIVSDCEYVYLNNGAIYYNDTILPQPTMTFDNCFFHDFTGDNGGLLIFGGSGASLIGTLNAIVNNPMVYGGTNAQWGIISDGAYVYINGGIVLVDSLTSSPLQIGCASPLGKISYMSVNGTKIINRLNGAGLRLNDSNDVVNLNNVNFDMGVGSSAAAVQGITAGHAITLQGVTRNDQGILVSAPNSTVTFKNFAGFGLDSSATVAATLINGLNPTGESVVGNGTIRANNGFGLFLHHAAVSTRIDQDGNFFIATNSTIPSTASFNGDMMLSNTNATSLYLYKSSMGGTAWTSRNLVLLDNSTLNGANISAGTLPITAADTSWPPRQNYPHIANTNSASGQIITYTGTNDIYGSPVYTNGPASSGGGLGSVTTTNAQWYDTNSTIHSSLTKDTNDVVNLQTNGVNTVSLNPVSGITTATGTSNWFGTTNYLGGNAAPLGTSIQAGLHTVGLNKGWTNDFNRQADLVINVTVTDAVAGVPILGFTNTTTGESYTNSPNFGIAGSPVYSIYYIDISPNDFGSFSNYSTGSGTSITINSAWWKLK